MIDDTKRVLRPAICMVCLWAWASGVPETELATCPRCGWKAGTPSVLERTGPTAADWAKYVIYGPPEELMGWIGSLNG